MSRKAKALRASDVSRALGDAGHTSAASAVGADLVADTNERGYRSKQAGERVHVRFIGRAADESDMISRYRLAVTNLGLRTVVVPDSDRSGRVLLEVYR